MRCPKCGSGNYIYKAHKGPLKAIDAEVNACLGCGQYWTAWQQAEIERLKRQIEMEKELWQIQKKCTEDREAELTTLRAALDELKKTDYVIEYGRILDRNAELCDRLKRIDEKIGKYLENPKYEAPQCVREAAAIARGDDDKS